LDDLWINQPTPKEELLDPKIEFHKELNTAQIFARNFTRMINEYAQDLIDYKNLSRDPDAEHRLISKQKELKLDLERLMDEEKRLHSDREFVYKKG
jgi:cell shape-determining protein MreC